MGDPQPLLLASGESADRRVSVGAGAYRVDGLVHEAPSGSAGPGLAEPVPVGTERHQIAAASSQVRVESSLLRDVPDDGAATPWFRSAHSDGSGSQMQQSEQHLEQRRLAGPVRAKDGQELPSGDGQVQLGPQPTTPEFQRRLLELGDRHGVGRCRLPGQPPSAITCPLYSNTLTVLCVIAASNAAVSAGLGSLPSSTAWVKPAGTPSFRSAASVR